MAITLTEQDLPARLTRHGSDTVTLQAGDRLQVRRGMPIEELLDVTVPAGKMWTATVNVHIVET